ncbi:MAG: hypothetical protein AMXMBFR58_30200 [Phycisphaerae bacterium]
MSVQRTQQPGAVSRGAPVQVKNAESAKGSRTPGEGLFGRLMAARRGPGKPQPAEPLRGPIDGAPPLVSCLPGTGDAHARFPAVPQVLGAPQGLCQLREQPAAVLEGSGPYARVATIAEGTVPGSDPPCPRALAENDDRRWDSTCLRECSDRLALDAVVGQDDPATPATAPSTALPTPVPQDRTVDHQPKHQGGGISQDEWERLVEYAQVVRDADQNVAVRLALRSEVHGGLAMEVRSVGEGRVSLQILSTGQSLSADDASLQSLRAALELRRLDVAAMDVH